MRVSALKYLNLAFVVARFALVLALLLLTLNWRTPLFASWRDTALTALIVLPLAVIAIEIIVVRRAAGRSRALRLIGGSNLALAVIVLCATAAIDIQFRYQRHAVLAADPRELEALGRHLLIGYRDEATLRILIEHRAIAGVYLSARNVEGKTAATIRKDVQSLQDMRRAQGLDPLWIATDQEGGTVSRLSPPLTRLPPLAEIIALHRDHAEQRLAVAQYASRQGRELASIGVNLNFAPVVDLNHGVVNPDDRLTRIASRAISDDPAVVTEVAGLYCATLMMTGVHCTLKHFPGLGRVYGDTHTVSAKLDARSDELEDTDWVPFRQLMSESGAFTMLGHARLTAVDKDHPASFSDAVVHSLLRESWKQDGILVTDDFSMGAVTLSPEGAAGGAVEALNAGVDLILVSYDPDQYFPVMYALLQAKRDGRLRLGALEQSVARLHRAASR